MFVVRREPHNPILSPQRERPWEAEATFNPSAVRTKDGVRIFYRAIGNPDVLQTPNAGLSSIGTAFSEDGVHFHSRQQVITPGESFDHFGCEDPRVTLFEGKWYCFYTALGGYPFGPDNIKVAVAVGDSPEHFTERHLITPFNAKAATLFPERIDGDIVLMLTAHTDWTSDYPRPTIALARAKRMEDFYDPDYWETWHKNLALHALPQLRRIDDDHIEVGASPLKTKQGWLLIYSYIEDYYDSNKRVFSIEAAMLDAHDPQKLISRTESIIVPEDVYEKYGLIPNIVFPSGATVDTEGRLEIWYGAADTVCAKATLRLADLLHALDPNRPARTFIRGAHNPILVPQGDGFESQAVFNAAAFDLDGSVHILYRAMDKMNTSTIGLALSKDGVTIDERLPEPVYVPRAEFEQKRGSLTGNSGCEDPRATIIGDPSRRGRPEADRLYLTYTAYDGVVPPRGALSSISLDDLRARRFDAWSAPVLITPDNVDDKDTALVQSEKPGEYHLYHRVSNRICIDIVNDLTFTHRVTRCIEIMGPRRGMWDSAKVGIAGPPIRVPEGWLVIYHGVSRHATYRLGIALLDPTGFEILARTADPVFEPLEKYELEGIVPNVVFSCGAVLRGDELLLYYGGGDKVIGVATASLAHIRASLT